MLEVFATVKDLHDKWDWGNIRYIRRVISTRTTSNNNTNTALGICTTGSRIALGRESARVLISGNNMLLARLLILALELFPGIGRYTLGSAKCCPCHGSILEDNQTRVGICINHSRLRLGAFRHLVFVFNEMARGKFDGSMTGMMQIEFVYKFMTWVLIAYIDRIAEVVFGVKYFRVNLDYSEIQGIITRFSRKQDRRGP